jgi:hypothetical protein
VSAEAALERVQTLVRAAATLADPLSALGREARAVLPASTRLSPEGVELALGRCLETNPPLHELERLVADVSPAPAAHVLLPANVFIAAHRAIALALAESPLVQVRPSRREGAFVRLLARAAPGLFTLTEELAPSRGDSVWAYGTDETLSAVLAQLPEGIRFHASGAGFGIAVIDAASADGTAARGLAQDIVAFDQRGCLSPRLALFAGTRPEARAFAAAVAAELRSLATEVPLGALLRDEAATVTRFRDSAAYAGELELAGPGYVAVLEHVTPAPVGRNLVIVPNARPEALLRPLASSVTSAGVAASASLVEIVRRVLPHARVSGVGHMQRPPFDGPADRRPNLRLA